MNAVEIAECIEHLLKALAAEAAPSHVAREINGTILRLLRRLEALTGTTE